MVYTQEDFDRMEGDPKFARQYFWRCAMGMKKRGAEARARLKRQAVFSSAVRFDEASAAARDELRWAEIEEAVAAFVLANLDKLAGLSQSEGATS